MNRRRWIVAAVVAVVVVALVIASAVSRHNQRIEDERRGDRLYCQLVDDPNEHAPDSGELCSTVLTGVDQ